LPFVLGAIIALLISALAYQIDQNRRTVLGHAQFELAVFTQLYQNLDRGEEDAARQRLGALVTTTVDGLQQHYGPAADTRFALMLPAAKTIKTNFAAQCRPAK